MDFRQLETFLRVVEAGTLSRAAAQLNLAQPSVSKQIRNLEIELRHKLFVRNGRGVVLTEAGKCLLEHAQAVVASVERTRTALAEFHQTERSGRVVIGIPSRIARTLTVPLFEAFKAAFPHASLTVAEGLSITLQEWLLSGRLDLAVLFEPSPPADLKLLPLSWEELVLVAGRKAAATLPETIAVRQLRRYPLILPRRPNTIRALVESACRRAGIEVAVTAEVDTVPSILELVSRNSGYSVIPGSSLANQPNAAVVTARIHSPSIRMKMVLARSSLRPLTRLAELTMDLFLGIDVAGLLRQHPLPSTAIAS